MSLHALNDEWIASAEIRAESDVQWILDYYLQRFESNDEGENSAELYGIRIDKSTPEGVLHEREKTPAITECRDEAIAMARQFAKGTVPPATLLEMVDECIDDVAEATLQEDCCEFA